MGWCFRWPIGPVLACWRLCRWMAHWAIWDGLLARLCVQFGSVEVFFWLPGGLCECLRRGVDLINLQQAQGSQESI